MGSEHLTSLGPTPSPSSVLLPCPLFPFPPLLPFTFLFTRLQGESGDNKLQYLCSHRWACSHPNLTKLREPFLNAGSWSSADTSGRAHWFHSLSSALERRPLDDQGGGVIRWFLFIFLQHGKLEFVKIRLRPQGNRSSVQASRRRRLKLHLQSGDWLPSNISPRIRFPGCGNKYCPEKQVREENPFVSLHIHFRPSTQMQRSIFSKEMGTNQCLKAWIISIVSLDINFLPSESSVLRLNSSRKEVKILSLSNLSKRHWVI